VRPKNERPPPWSAAKGEGESKATTSSLNPLLAGSKPFDPVEKKLSLTLDALLDAIDSYRETKR